MLPAAHLVRDERALPICHGKNGGRYNDIHITVRFNPTRIESLLLRICRLPTNGTRATMHVPVIAMVDFRVAS